MNQGNIPLLQLLEGFSKDDPISFHVPGHKHGSIFPKVAKNHFKAILQLDLTELPGLDDLHAPHGAIGEAEKLASDFFGADHTFFLINGSTVGNLAMILAVCRQNDHVLVQRNSHKSIFNGLELAGAKPIFLTPEYDSTVERFTSPSVKTLEQALIKYPNAKALVLTYPDYFGRTYDIKSMIELAHERNIPVLVDEAHGVHFAIGKPFPRSALAFGADVVVHSAHKTAPAMTMASYLHIKSKLVTKESLAYRLQMLQSSSPSYPLMASLDVARYFLAVQNKQTIQAILQDAEKINLLFEAERDLWEIVPSDDPIKLTIQLKDGYTAKEAARLFEASGVYPEFTMNRQILFILGLAPFKKWGRLKKVLHNVKETLKNTENHATIEMVNIFTDMIQELTLSYQEMANLTQVLIPMEAAVGQIAAEPVIPYPPGIPLILKGEMITGDHIAAIKRLMEQGVRIQQREEGIRIFRRT